MTKNDYIYNGKIINVVDGDTCDIEIDLGFYVFARERMRLNGIDTPELNSPDDAKRNLAKEAKIWLSNYLNLSVTLKSFKKDKYGRFLVDIFVEGVDKSLNEQLIDAGLAVAYSGGARV